MKTSRRNFISHSGKLIAGTSLASMLPLETVFAQKRKVSANDKIQVALIGCNGMGFVNLKSMLKVEDVECIGLCDIDDNVLTARSAELEKITGKKVKTYKDFRKLLEIKELDAVIIGTPDHWHCLITIYACQAGKDVYVEKPLANSVGECLAMVSAKQKYNRVVQVGQWQRSNQHWKDATDYVKSGKLGKIRMAKSWIYSWKNALPVVPDESAPAGVDYDMWLGPAPKRAFNKNRFHGNFRWYWDYAGGLMTDWGVHLLDMALLGMNATTPKSIISSGGKYAFPDDAMQTPDTQTAIYEFNDFSISWEHTAGISTAPYGRSHGVAFVGTLGTLVVDRDQWMILPEPDGLRYKTDSIPVQRVKDNGLDNHTANFIACLKSRQQTNCPIETAASTAIISHFGNIAYRTGRRIFLDDAKKSFGNDAEANALLMPTYREPWAFPKV